MSKHVSRLVVAAAFCAASLCLATSSFAAAKKPNDKKSGHSAAVLTFRNATVGNLQTRPPSGQVRRMMVGKRHAFQPFHWAKAPSDHPVVHYLTSALYQNDQHFADLFSSSGASEICGPTSLSNVLLYLKRQHGPTYPQLFEHDGLPHNYTERDVVHYMFRICGTSRENGTTSVQLKNCAGTVLGNSHYGHSSLFVKGAYSDESPRITPVTPADLRRASTTTWRRGGAEATADKATVLLFGWYSRGTYVRNGGHFVALAGYDSVDSNTFYVGNPLIDYPRGHAFSKIKLERVPANAPMVQNGLPLGGMYQTEHLFGDASGIIAVLENVVEVGPTGAGVVAASGSSSRGSHSGGAKRGSAKKPHH